MGAGAGAQKITTDVTGNDTAGMVAGMVASGVTAKGLNGIEADRKSTRLNSSHIL